MRDRDDMFVNMIEGAGKSLSRALYEAHRDAIKEIREKEKMEKMKNEIIEEVMKRISIRIENEAIPAIQ